MVGWWRHPILQMKYTFILILAALFGAHALSFKSLSQTPSTGRDSMQILRTAMQFSNESAKNITSAHLACRNWDELLNSHVPSRLFQVNDGILRLSLALYASCLIRIGKDTEAVGVLDRALQIDPTNQDLRLSKAEALQRLLKYSDAREEFRHVKSKVGVLGAVTCSLRLADLSSAIEDLKASKLSSSECSLQCMLDVLKYIQGEEAVLGNTITIQEACQSDPLFRWIQFILNPRIASDFGAKESPCSAELQMSLMRMNLCPLDDPSLIVLDDKVNLHQLLDQDRDMNQHFWPAGIILGNVDNSGTLSSMIASSPDSLFLLKERSGYGSHGNRILSGSTADEELRSLSQSNIAGDERLLQRMVDPPFLLRGRKFSLRIYVVYFSPTEVYLSPHGLVKLASILYDGTNINPDPNQHMTNSGRDVAMEQHSLEYLKICLAQEGYSYEDFWHRIEDSIVRVFECFEGQAESFQHDAEERRQSLGIPKIMGFDFVVDSDIRPWLVEVNRFPGMEPRDRSDLHVKYQVIRDAWVCAHNRVTNREAVCPHPLESLLQSLDATNDVSSRDHSLKRLRSTG